MQSTWMAKIFGDRGDPRVRLQDLFGGEVPESGQPPERALEWALRVLADAEPDVSGDLVSATTCLRKAESRLTLRSAVFLAQHAIDRR